MKRLRSISCALLLLPVVANAYQLHMGDSTNALVLPAGETLADEACWIAYRLDFHGQAARDLWLIATSDVQFAGESCGDLRVLANSAVLTGVAQQNLLAYANGLQLTSNSVVRGQAALFGTALICEGTVEGDAWILAKSVTLGGRWAGNVRIHASEIRIAPGTTIAGNLVYTSPKTLVYDASVAIAGTVTQTQVMPQSTFAGRIAWHGYLFLAALLVGLPFVGLFPLQIGGAVRNLRASPWRVLIAGVLTLLLGPFLIAFAFMTILGIPLALLLGALYLALLYLSHIVIALWLGHMLLRAPGPQTFARVLAALITGLFLLYFSAAVPGVVSFVLLPVLVLGTGALVLTLWRRPILTIPLPPPVPPFPPPPPESTENQA